MLALHVQDLAAETTAATGGFAPVLLGWIVLLPLIGFLINGAAALYSAVRNRPPTLAQHPPHESEHASEEEAQADLHEAHPATPEPHAGQAAGWTHSLPSLVAPGVVGLAFVIALVNFFRMVGAELHDPVIATYWSWMPVDDLQVDAALQLDQLSILMTLVITGVGFLIHIFSVGYMRQDPGYPRYMAYLNLFIFFMLVLVLGSSFPVMFVGWEGVGLCSYLLIGFWFGERANADAGKKAFIVNRIGDFGFLMAMLLLFAHLGTLNFWQEDGRGVFELAGMQFPFGGVVVTLICLFLLLGAAGKSAQIPLYVWLPDAMAGPTPVSALIHAATMVTAGVYLVARSSVLFALAPAASLTVALVGALTAIFAATIGLKQWDIKKVLAYSTVSQLGFMFAAVGVGAYTAGVFHLMTHAFFKACLFLGSGAVIHAMHHALHATHSPADAQDMRNMGGLRRYMPVTFLTMLVATLAIAGVPPFAGFFSKDEILAATLAGAQGYSGFSHATWLGIPGSVVMGFIWGTLVLAALMTAFYMGRLIIYTFFGGFRGGPEEAKHLHEVGPSMTIPLIVLAVLSVVGGLVNVVEDAPIVNVFDFGQGEALHHFLHPVTLGAEQVMHAYLPMPEYVPHPAWPIVLAILVGIGGLALAFLILRPDRVVDAERTPAYAGDLQKALFNKWYVDEIYHVVVVRPVVAVSRIFATAFDRHAIDGLIDGALGRGAQAVGLLMGRMQTGLVNTYAFVIIVGALAVIGTFVYTAL
jgi:NADH-quinone oxidoreductase subunit L